MDTNSKYEVRVHCVSNELINNNDINIVNDQNRTLITKCKNIFIGARTHALTRKQMYIHANRSEGFDQYCVQCATDQDFSRRFSKPR